MKKQRSSNFELLRLLAMMFVLIVHADFIAFGAPDVADWARRPVGVVSQYVFECLAICCVDVFVLISGWFGIKFSFRKFSAFFFQVVFFSAGLFLVAAVVTPQKAFTIEGIKSVFLLNGGDYWFVKAYMVLMILSPFLNAFCDHASRCEFKTVLTTYLMVMFVYGWLEPASVSFAMNGCTTLSFVGLYLIGRYMHIHRPAFTSYSMRKDGLAYLAISVIMMLACLFLLKHGLRPTLNSRLLNYGCPLVILAAMYLLLFFSKWNFSSRFVNRVSVSCLAVYLFHCNLFIFPIYKDLVRKANEMGGALMILAFLLLVYVVAIGADRIRLFLWRKLEKKLYND